MNCYNQLKFMQDCINNKGGFSHNKLDELNEKNELVKMFTALNIDELLRYEFYSFIRLVESNNEYHEHLNKIFTHEAEFLNIFSQFGYVLSLYFGNKEAYRNFSLFFKECSRHYNISKYANMSVEQIEKFLSRYLDIYTEYNYNSKRYLNLVAGKIPELYTTYSKYDNKLNNKNEPINYKDKDEFFVYSEYDSYQRELHALSYYYLSNPKDYVKWVSRYHGDGYGYDILSYDIKRNREKLIEVKSGITDNIDLTRIEYKTMLDTINRPYSDYYIYKYYYDADIKIVILTVLKYNKEKNVCVDVNTNEIYKFIPYFYFDEKGNQKVSVDVVKEEKYNKLLKK